MYRLKYSLRSVTAAVVVISAVCTIFTECTSVALKRTGRELDLAIVGPGHFEAMDLETGVSSFFRYGSLYVNDEGNLAHAEAGVLTPPLIVPADAHSIHVQPDGWVWVSCYGEREMIGGIMLAVPAESGSFESIGRGLSLPANGSYMPLNLMPGSDGVGSLKQGWLEEPRIAVNGGLGTVILLALVILCFWLR